MIGLEDLVSKRADRPYRANRSKDWVKVKNRKRPTIQRVKGSFA
jgi:bifunctional non-homologous end joining protein LigD